MTVKNHTKVCNVLFPKSASTSTEAKLLDSLPVLFKEARDRRDDCLAADTGRRSSIRSAQWRLFNSHAVKVAAAVKANARRRPSRRISLVKCFDAAGEIKWAIAFGSEPEWMTLATKRVRRPHSDRLLGDSVRLNAVRRAVTQPAPELPASTYC